MVTVPSLIQLVLNASIQYFVRQHLHRSFDHLAQLGRRPFLCPMRRDLALVRSATKLATVKRENKARHKQTPSQYSTENNTQSTIIQQERRT